MTADELERLAELEAKRRGPGEHKDANEFDFSNAVFDAAPDLIALARWAEKARELLGESESFVGGSAILSMEAVQALLAAYPEKT